jgi:thioredoxin 1
MVNTLQVNNSNFDAEVIKSEMPVLIDFWAPWCGPCKMITPIVEELAEDYQGRVKVAKINVDDNQDLAARYGIRGIPTVMIFKDGDRVASFVGVRSKEDLSRELDKHV